MFGIKHNECVGFESRWTVKKVYYEGATQTPLYVAKNAATETNQSKEVEVQTDTPEVSKTAEVDIDKLAGFLTKIYPRVKKELDESLSSKAFVGYRLQGDSVDATCKLLQSVEVIPQRDTNEFVNTPKLSSMSWNSSGKTIALSLSYSHQYWCYDPGYILIYTLDRDDKLPSTPTKKMSCDSCVTQIQFHPFMPALLVGSTHAGLILLWNIQNNEDDALIMKISRSDSVSFLNWMTLDYATMDIVFLVTASLDGTITMWRFNNSYTCANVYEKYKIKAPLMTKSKNKTIKSLKANESEVGVTCFDFSKHLPDMFVVGTEGGLVIQCSTSKPTKLKGSTETDPIYDPVYQYYQPHEGRVINIQFSKVRKDVFMTTGADLQTRLYVIGQEEAARVIFLKNSINPLYWVPHEKHLIFGYGSNGHIDVFNVISGRAVKPTEEVRKNNSSNLNALCYINPLKPNVVAVALQEGVLELWMVPWGSFARISD